MNVKCNRLIHNAVPTLFDVPSHPPRCDHTRHASMKQAKQAIPQKQPKACMPSPGVVVEQTIPEFNQSPSKDDFTQRTPTKQERMPISDTLHGRLLLSIQKREVRRCKSSQVTQLCYKYKYKYKYIASSCTVYTADQRALI